MAVIVLHLEMNKTLIKKQVPYKRICKQNAPFYLEKNCWESWVEKSDKDLGREDAFIQNVNIFAFDSLRCR